MKLKFKHAVGLGCIATGLIIGNANAHNFLCGGECYLGGSFGKAFTGKKIKGKHIPIAQDIGWANAGDTQDLSYKRGNAFYVFFGTKKDNIRYQLEFSSLETKYKDIWNNSESNPAIAGSWNPIRYEGTKSLSLIPQILYDFSVERVDSLIPYIGAGIGYSKIKNYMTYALPGAEETKRENKLAGQLIAGVRYKFTDNLAASLDYKYFRALGKIKALDSSYYNHSVQLGLVVDI